MVDPQDRAEVAELLARYAEAIDDGDFAAVGELFSEAELVDGDGHRFAAGAESVEALFTAMTRRHDDGTPKTAHLVTNVIVEQVDGAVDELQVRSRFLVVQATDTVALQTIVAGRYVDRVRRGANGWYFVRRQMRPELWGDVSDHLLS